MRLCLQATQKTRVFVLQINVDVTEETEEITAETLGAKQRCARTWLHDFYAVRRMLNQSIIVQWTLGRHLSRGEVWPKSFVAQWWHYFILLSVEKT